MARMIPETIDESTKSYAERILFRLFRDMDELTKNWIVIHSVRLINHPTQIQGETDFVVIVPNKGWFTLEVKGGAISYYDGNWTSKNKKGIHKIKNPIIEADETMQALIDFLKKKKLGGFISGFGVMFPDVSIRKELSLPDLDEKQIYDADDLGNVKSYILRLADFWKKRCSANSHLVAPSVEQCNEIADAIRDEYQPNVAMSTRIYNTENQIIQLTDNQKHVFDGLKENEQCIVHGGAGTGKTVIAVQYVKELAEEGKRVGLFCYNKQLADYLKKALSGYPSVTCDSFTEFMLKESKLKVPDHNIGDFYEHELPQHFAVSFLDGEKEQFDCLVLDEAQDLISEDYLDALDAVLDNGLDDGHWTFFLDADRQNLYRSSMKYKDVIDLLKLRKLRPARYRLDTNCRNSPAIVKFMDEIFGMNSEYLPQDEEGIQVITYEYRRHSEQAEQLKTLLKELKEESVKNDDIVILSPYRNDKSVINELSDDSITCDMNHRSGKILFSTIQGYKGLESTVVIVTDIDKMMGEGDRNLLYVGMSRAKSALYLFANKNVKLVK